MDEIVALYGPDGRETGSAPRSRVRAENLRHGATGVVLFRPDGRLFVHQRTDTKDVYPGRWDATAGGVMEPGETPLAAAERELAEELGVKAPLVWIGEADYADANTSYRAFLFWAVTEQEPRLQPEEVQAGVWMSREGFLAAAEAEPERFMPDTLALLGDWLRSQSNLPPLGRGPGSSKEPG